MVVPNVHCFVAQGGCIVLHIAREISRYLCGPQLVWGGISCHFPLFPRRDFHKKRRSQMPAWSASNTRTNVYGKMKRIIQVLNSVWCIIIFFFFLVGVSRVNKIHRIIFIKIQRLIVIITTWSVTDAHAYTRKVQKITFGFRGGGAAKPDMVFLRFRSSCIYPEGRKKMLYTRSILRY